MKYKNIKYSMKTNFPKYTFVPEDYNKTILELNLAPSSTILITSDEPIPSTSPVAPTTTSYNNNDYWGSMWTNTMSYLNSFIYPPQPVSNNTTTNVNTTTNTTTNTRSNNYSGSNIRQLSDSEPENRGRSTWNGNSTVNLDDTRK